MPRTARFAADAGEHEAFFLAERVRRLETALAIEMPYISTYAGAAYGLGTGTYTSIPLTAAFAQGMEVTSGAIEAPVTGTYQVNFGVAFASASADGGFSVLFVNGTGVSQGSSDSFNGDPGRTSTGSRILQLNAGDQIELYAYQNTGGALAVESGQNRTYVDVFMLLDSAGVAGSVGGGGGAVTSVAGRTGAVTLGESDILDLVSDLEALQLVSQGIYRAYAAQGVSYVTLPPNNQREFAVIVNEDPNAVVWLCLGPQAVLPLSLNSGSAYTVAGGPYTSLTIGPSMWPGAPIINGSTGAPCAIPAGTVYQMDDGSYVTVTTDQVQGGTALAIDSWTPTATVGGTSTMNPISVNGGACIELNPGASYTIGSPGTQWTTYSNTIPPAYSGAVSAIAAGNVGLLYNSSPEIINPPLTDRDIMSVDVDTAIGIGGWLTDNPGVRFMTFTQTDTSYFADIADVEVGTAVTTDNIPAFAGAQNALGKTPWVYAGDSNYTQIFDALVGYQGRGPLIWNADVGAITCTPPGGSGSFHYFPIQDISGNTVTTYDAHNLSNGDAVFIVCAFGCPNVNGAWYPISSVTTNTFDVPVSAVGTYTVDPLPAIAIPFSSTMVTDMNEPGVVADQFANPDGTHSMPPEWIFIAADVAAGLSPTTLSIANPQASGAAGAPYPLIAGSTFLMSNGDLVTVGACAYGATSVAITDIHPGPTVGTGGWSHTHQNLVTIPNFGVAYGFDISIHFTSELQITEGVTAPATTQTLMGQLGVDLTTYTPVLPVNGGVTAYIPGVTGHGFWAQAPSAYSGFLFYGSTGSTDEFYVTAGGDAFFNGTVTATGFSGVGASLSAGAGINSSDLSSFNEIVVTNPLSTWTLSNNSYIGASGDTTGLQGLFHHYSDASVIDALLESGGSLWLQGQLSVGGTSGSPDFVLTGSGAITYMGGSALSAYLSGATGTGHNIVSDVGPTITGPVTVNATSGSLLIGQDSGSDTSVLDYLGNLWVAAQLSVGNTLGSPEFVVTGSGAITRIAGNALGTALIDVTGTGSDIVTNVGPSLTGPVTVSATSGDILVGQNVSTDTSVLDYLGNLWAAGQLSIGNTISSPNFVVTGAGAITYMGGAALTDYLSGATGTGHNIVSDVSPTITSPTLVTPALGTPASGVLSNCTTVQKSAFDWSNDLAATAYVENAGTYRPKMNGYTAWSFDPIWPTLGVAPTKGTIYYMQVYVPIAFTVGHVDIYVSSAGTPGSSSPTAYVGIYSAAGAQLAVSSNVEATIGTNTGVIALPISYAFTSPGYYWIALLIGNTWTTSPTLFQSDQNTTGLINANTTNGSGTLGTRSATGTTGQTVLPSPISGTPSAGGAPWWCGLR